MSTYVIVEFIKLHAWPWSSGYKVYHGLGQDVDYSSPLISTPSALWSTVGQKAGFGFGRFGYGSFGWGQGFLFGGGFGAGRFGYGEFGYYNQLESFQVPEPMRDGVHSFAVKLFDSCGNSSPTAGEGQILIIGTPKRPRNLKLVAFASGRPTVQWLASGDLG